MINVMNSSGAQAVQPTGSQLATGLQPYTASVGSNPYSQVLGGAMGSLSQAMSNPQLMKMLADRLKTFGGVGAAPEAASSIPTVSPVGLNDIELLG